MGLPVRTGAPYRGYRVWRLVHVADGYALGSLYYSTYWGQPVVWVPEADIDSHCRGLWACESRAMAGKEAADSFYQSTYLAPLGVPIYGEVELLYRYVRHRRGARGCVARVCRLWIPAWVAVLGRYEIGRATFVLDRLPSRALSDAAAGVVPNSCGPVSLDAIVAALSRRYDCDVGLGR